MHKVNVLMGLLVVLFWGVILYYGIPRYQQLRTEKKAAEAVDSIACPVEQEVSLVEIDKNFNITFNPSLEETFRFLSFVPYSVNNENKFILAPYSPDYMPPFWERYKRPKQKTLMDCLKKNELFEIRRQIETAISDLK